MAITVTGADVDGLKEILAPGALLPEQFGEGYAVRQLDLAATVFEEVALADDFADLLTLPAYEAVSA